MLLKNIWRRLPQCFKKPAYWIKGWREQGRIVYKKESSYSYIQVIDKKGYRYLVFKDPSCPLHLQRPEDIYQSRMSLDDTLDTGVPYADYFHLAWIFNPQIKDIIMIGLGGAAVPKVFLKDYPEIFFRTVEIDPEVVNIAYKYFFLSQDDRHKIIIGDGREYIKNTVDPADLVLLDAFYSRTIPHHLFTVEFFQEIKNKLNEEGLLAINFNGSLAGTNSFLFSSVLKSLRTIFQQIYVFASRKNSPNSMQNIIIFACKNLQNLGRPEIIDLARGLAEEKVTVSGFIFKARQLYEGPVELEEAELIRDALSPPGGMINLYNSRIGKLIPETGEG
ncbi:spermidine synthase [Candidatus Contubernalis alkaliaceticus]|uniref:spermidine synthase n=1 Tax=Candidatus Contubernalis alkaliaceticus TaxID=338645 RepID=UPI001F4BF919|nr:fused MFS/spermidine synthase [Candidatus Contubernalis alkalaceticus]UNC91381.1 fused MFS/spermidine synthase [Candidatus Contubernalis alkalaceticus]